MSRYIDADLLRTVKSIQSADFNSIETIQKWIDEQPTADVVEVVKCGECGNLHTEFKRTYCPLVDIWDINPQWYCADGERIGGANEN